MCRKREEAGSIAGSGFAGERQLRSQQVEGSDSLLRTQVIVWVGREANRLSATAPAAPLIALEEGFLQASNAKFRKALIRLVWKDVYYYVRPPSSSSGRPSAVQGNTPLWNQDECHQGHYVVE